MDFRHPESSSTGTPRPAANSDLVQMLAPISGFCREFFRNDHPQHLQRLVGTWLVVGPDVGSEAQPAMSGRRPESAARVRQRMAKRGSR